MPHKIAFLFSVASKSLWANFIISLSFELLPILHDAWLWPAPNLWALVLLLCHYFLIAIAPLLIKPWLLSSQYSQIRFQNASPFWSVPTTGSIDTFNYALISSLSSFHCQWPISCLPYSISSLLRSIASYPSWLENCEYCEVGVKSMGVGGDRSDDPPTLVDADLKSPNWIWNRKDGVLVFLASRLKMKGNGNWNISGFWLFEKKKGLGNLKKCEN